MGPRTWSAASCSPAERAYSTTVNGITHIDSQSISGIGILKIYFSPGAEIGAAMAQITSVSLTASRAMPPGILPPIIVQYNASNVPVAQLTVRSDTLSEQQLFDYGLNFLRLRLFTVPGLATPAPYGGKQRQIVVAPDPAAIAAHRLSTQDVLNALLQANLIVPAGSMRVGGTEYDVAINNSPPSVKEFERIPIKVVGGAEVTLGDVAQVFDGFATQQNIVRVNGRRATYLAILKKADASTLAVVDAARDLLPALRAAAPGGMEISLDFDQSTFVRAAIAGVLREGLISALLVSVMILLFLGSWRSVIIVSTSIPLAIFSALGALFLQDATLNIMTLGGLALAIGMLVDDATVEVENIHRNRHLGKPLTVAILDGAEQIAVPALAATLTICIVFSPVVLLFGPAKFLFTPLACAVVFSMLASYGLSRTLVPVLAQLLMASEAVPRGPRRAAVVVAALQPAPRPRLRAAAAGLRRRPGAAAGASTLRAGLRPGAAGLLGAPGAGRGHRFLPRGGRRADAAARAGAAGHPHRGHRAPGGEHRGTHPPGDSSRADKLHHRQPGHSHLLQPGVCAERQRWGPGRRRAGGPGPRTWPHCSAAPPPACDAAGGVPRTCTPTFSRRISSARCLTLASSSPVDIEVEGADLEVSMGIARQIRDGLRRIAGVVDVRVLQGFAHPALQVDVDRLRAAQLGVSQRDVANNLLTSLSSSALVAPSYWLSPVNNVNYLVAVQTPLEKANSVADLLATPISASAESGTQASSPFDNAVGDATYLGSIARVSPTQTKALISHATIARVVQVQCGVEGRDLGGVAADIEALLGGLQLPPNIKVRLQGQSQSMKSSFMSLGLGLLFAVVLVYLLLVTLFQSWVDPLIIMVAAPGALLGVLLILVATGTTVNVESLMGTIMAVGGGGVQQHSVGKLCQRAARGRRPRRPAGRPDSWADAPAAGADDRAGDDLGHAAHGPGLGGGRRAERAPGPRCHRGPAHGNLHDALCGAAGVLPVAPGAAQRAALDRAFAAQLAASTASGRA